MAYAVDIRPAAQKQLSKLPKSAQERIGKVIDALQQNPRPNGCEKLTAAHGFRIRVGDFRVVYTIEDSKLTVEVIKVADRKEVYRKK